MIGVDYGFFAETASAEAYHRGIRVQEEMFVKTFGRLYEKLGVKRDPREDYGTLQRGQRVVIETPQMGLVSIVPADNGAVDVLSIDATQGIITETLGREYRYALQR